MPRDRLVNQHLILLSRYLPRRWHEKSHPECIQIRINVMNIYTEDALYAGERPLGYVKYFDEALRQPGSSSASRCADTYTLDRTRTPRPRK